MKRFLIGLMIIIGFIGITGSATTQDNTVAYFGPRVYPENINPLTGLAVDDPSIFEQRPMIVKIVNAPEAARPQWGLMQADIVWEYLLAGGWTRFAAVFYSQAPERVGPIRSMRLVDFDLAHHYRAMVVTSGMSDGTWETLRSDRDLYARTIAGGPCPPMCRDTDIGREMDLTLMSSIPVLRAWADEHNLDTTGEPLGGMAFSSTVPQDGTALNSVEIQYKNAVVDYFYDADRNVWLREHNDEPHLDGVSGEQLYFDNVLIIETEHLIAPYTREAYWGYTNFAYHAPLSGSGRVVLLRDGQFFEGIWQRKDGQEFLQFYDASGNILPFTPGRTIFNLVPRWDEGYQLIFNYTQPPQATVTAVEGVYMRWGPTTTFGAADSAFAGVTFDVTGRNGDGRWIQIVDEEDRCLWLSTDYVELDVDVMDIPLVRSTSEHTP